MEHSHPDLFIIVESFFAKHHAIIVMCLLQQLQLAFI
jgi:hypothetical protein